ncbi:hypothetical protein ACIBUY_04805 [Streptomyces sp. NPDC050085]|uniref:hypothetical protein n=1 Tax=Streptomyces sp. NPDC050085 TaxID=3365600 RepID=UPI0037BB87DF
MSAQDLFKAMIKDRLAPALRGAGVVGSGQVFRLKAADPDFALLGFQKSSSNTEHRCRFTINLHSVTSMEHEERMLRFPERGTGTPNPNCTAPEGWNDRIGFALPAPA